MNQFEVQVLQGVLSLATVAFGVAISVLTPKLKALVDRHVSAKQAQLANHVIDGLAVIAEAVVQDFNQRVVRDAKLHGVFTPELAQSVKADAVAAVKAQGASLLALGKSVLGDTEALIGSLIEQAVAKYHVSAPKTQEEAPAEAESAAPAAQPSNAQDQSAAQGQ